MSPLLAIAAIVFFIYAAVAKHGGPERAEPYVRADNVGTERLGLIVLFASLIFAALC